MRTLNLELLECFELASVSGSLRTDDRRSNQSGSGTNQRHELMQMFKETSRPDQLPVACLERRVYEEPMANESAAGRAMVGKGGNEFLFIIVSVSGFDRRCQGTRKIGGCPTSKQIHSKLLMKLKVEEC